MHGGKWTGVGSGGGIQMISLHFIYTPVLTTVVRFGMVRNKGKKFMIMPLSQLNPNLVYPLRGCAVYQSSSNG